MKYVTLLLVMLLISCSTGKREGSMEKSNSSISVNENDSGKTVNMNTGDTLKIVLSANKTTGYQWSISNDELKTLKKISDEYIPDKKSKNVVGSGGKYVLSLKAVNQGKTSLKLLYSRSFEKNAQPLKTYNLTIVVK